MLKSLNLQRWLRDMSDTKSDAILSANKLHSAEFYSPTWFAPIPPDVPLERILEPGFWSKCVRELQRQTGGVIRCLSFDNYYAELLIREVTAYSVRVSLLHHVELHELDVIDSDLPPNFKVFFSGAPTLWTVQRGDQVLRDEFPDKQSAMTYARELAAA